MGMLEAAQRIVAIQGQLIGRISARDRNLLMQEQRQLWDEHWPTTGFDRLERITRH